MPFGLGVPALSHALGNSYTVITPPKSFPGTPRPVDSRSVQGVAFYLLVWF
jgi:hypothetical protein